MPAETGGERHAKTLVAATEQMLRGRKLASRDSRTCGQTLRPSDVSKALHAQATNQIEAYPCTEDHERAPQRPRRSRQPCSPPFLSFAHVVYRLHLIGWSTKWSTFPLRRAAARHLRAPNFHEI